MVSEHSALIRYLLDPSPQSYTPTPPAHCYYSISEARVKCSWAAIRGWGMTPPLPQKKFPVPHANRGGGGAGARPICQGPPHPTQNGNVHQLKWAASQHTCPIPHSVAAGLCLLPMADIGHNK